MPGFFESLRQGKEWQPQEQQIPHPVLTIKDSSNRYSVIDADGNTIVPYGYYLYISQFRFGLARVKTGDRFMGPRVFDGSLPEEALEYKWGIIDSNGKEVVLPVYDYIRGFDRTRQITIPAKKDGQDCLLSLKGLSKEYDAFLNAPIRSRGFFASLNSGKPREHYDEFEGTYAQEVEGYSDEDIYDAFDGEPDAYWNID